MKPPPKKTQMMTDQMTQLDHSCIFMLRIPSKHITEILVLIEALGTVAELWKQSRCLPTEEKIEEIVYRHNEILFKYTE